MRANVADLERLKLRQVVMRDVSSRDQSVDVLRQRLPLPIILAPIGLGGMFARRAEVQAVRAAGRAGVPNTWLVSRSNSRNGSVRINMG